MSNRAVMGRPPVLKGAARAAADLEIEAIIRAHPTLGRGALYALLTDEQRVHTGEVRVGVLRKAIIEGIPMRDAPAREVPEPLRSIQQAAGDALEEWGADAKLLLRVPRSERAPELHLLAGGGGERGALFSGSPREWLVSWPASWIASLSPRAAIRADVLGVT